MTTVNTYVSQCFGRKIYDDCSHYCWQAVYLGLAYTCCTFVLIWPLAPRIFVLMSQPESIIELEVTYLRIMLVGQFVVVFIWATNQFFMGVHRAEVTMITALISQVVNVAANYVLIFGKFGFPEMGIAGAAWGTVIGAAVNAFTRTFWFLGPATHRQFRSRSTLRLDLPKIWDLLKIGSPAGFAFCVNTAFVGALLFTLIGRFGEDALAATSAVYSCMTVSFMPVVGMGVALTAVVGKSIGRGDKAAATQQTRRALIVAVMYMGAVGAGFYLFRHDIIRIWGLNGTASAIGAKLLVCAAIFQIFDAVLITYNGALRGAGDTLWLGFITTIGAVLILALGGGIIVVKWDYV
jgi:MATE family multidrug resistance protein